ncbi:helix-turn-helix domain-containing protein, partial [Candidatus Falkowbacteria bacterium]|nr:helix-turn-helix domain-containing protein [Candidatus Falkowbacteria bacterium]
MTALAEVSAGLPAWLPEFARLYLRHVEEGVPIRQLARDEGCHASTVLR